MINTKDFQLRELSKTDLLQVANLHQLAFPESALNHFGGDAIMRYYEWHMTPPNCCYPIGAFQDNKLVGFCFSGVFRNAELYFYRDNLLFLFGFLLAHPKIIFKFDFSSRAKGFLTYLFEKIQKRRSKASLELNPIRSRFGVLSIATDPSLQGKGIGKLLMKSVEEYGSLKNYPVINLSVHNDNESAINFYLKLGFIKVPGKNGVWKGVMFKNLKNFGVIGQSDH